MSFQTQNAIENRCNIYIILVLIIYYEIDFCQDNCIVFYQPNYDVGHWVTFKGHISNSEVGIKTIRIKTNSSLNRIIHKNTTHPTYTRMQHKSMKSMFELRSATAVNIYYYNIFTWRFF